MRWLAECEAELAAEMGAREASHAGHVIHAQRLKVAAVGGVLGAEKVTSGRDEGHVLKYRSGAFRFADGA